MRKYFKIITILVAVLILTVYSKALAASGSLYVSSSNVNVGDTFIVTASVDNSAAWSVHVSASGPVSGCTINQAGDSGDGSNISRQFTANCTANGVGTITVSLSGDVSQQNEDLSISKSYLSGSSSISVTEKSEPTPTPNPNPQPNPDNKQEENKKSNNNKVKELSVEGYELVKVDDNNYTLSVKNDVTKINIKAASEDSKSTISGIGEHVLTVGENTIEIICKAEDGSENKIIIKVTREEKEKEKDIIPKKNDTKKETEKETKKNISKTDLILILLMILNVVLLVGIIILIINNIKLRKKLNEKVSEPEPIEFLDTNN